MLMLVALTAAACCVLGVGIFLGWGMRGDDMGRAYRKGWEACDSSWRVALDALAELHGRS